MATNPEAWGPVVAAQPAESRPAKDLHVIPGEPVEFVGPPDWLQWQDKVLIIPADEPMRNTISAHRELIDGCDYRGPVISEGCACQRVCFQGNGWNPDGLSFGKVYESDCWKCVSE